MAAGRWLSFVGPGAGGDPGGRRPAGSAAPARAPDRRRGPGAAAVGRAGVPAARRRSAGRLIAAGALGLIGYNLPVTAGLQWLPAATAGLLLASEPVWVMLIGRVFLAERAAPGPGWAARSPWAAWPCWPAGRGDRGAAFRALAGTGLILAGTLAFGAYTVVLRPLSDAYGAIPATAASTVAGAIPYLAFAGTVRVPARPVVRVGVG